MAKTTLLQPGAGEISSASRKPPRVAYTISAEHGPQQRIRRYRGMRTGRDNTPDLDPQLRRLLEDLSADEIVHMGDYVDPDEIRAGLGRAVKLGFVRGLTDGGWGVTTIWRITARGRQALGEEPQRLGLFALPLLRVYRLIRSSLSRVFAS